MTPTFSDTYRHGRLNRTAADQGTWGRVRRAELRFEFHLDSPLQAVPCIPANHVSLLTSDGGPNPRLTELVETALKQPVGRQAPGWVASKPQEAPIVLDKVCNPAYSDVDVARFLVQTQVNWWGLEVEGRPGSGAEGVRYLRLAADEPLLTVVASALRADARRGLVRLLAEQAF